MINQEDTIEAMPLVKHAKLSASASAKWINCAGSVKAESNIKVTGSSPAAQEGSCAHAVAEIGLTTDRNIDLLIGAEVEGWEVTQEIVDYAHDYINYVKSFSGVGFYEQKVDYSNIAPEGFGTADAIIIDESEKLVRVIDLKYGRGVVVDAVENTQGILYALGVMNDYGHLYDIENVEIHIYQPRLGNFSVWAISADELEDHGRYIKERAKLALSPNPPRTAGEKQCRWCAAKATCKELSDHTLQVISGEFDNLDNLDDLDDLPPADTLPDDRTKLILDNKKLIESYLKAVEEHARDQLHAGEKIDGYKLVRGRSLRKWGDDSRAAFELESLVGDDAYERKLLTPAKAEKLLGSKRKKDIEHLIVKPEGAPTLAPESDKRKELKKVDANDFDILY